MKSFAKVALVLLFGTVSTALNPMSQAIAQEADMSSPDESSLNQQIDIQSEVDIQTENEIEIELEPEQSTIYTPEPLQENAVD